MRNTCQRSNRRTVAFPGIAEHCQGIPDMHKHSSTMVTVQTTLEINPRKSGHRTRCKFVKIPNLRTYTPLCFCPKKGVGREGGKRIHAWDRIHAAFQTRSRMRTKLCLASQSRSHQEQFENSWRWDDAAPSDPCQCSSRLQVSTPFAARSDTEKAATGLCHLYTRPKLTNLWKGPIFPLLERHLPVSWLQ